MDASPPTCLELLLWWSCVENAMIPKGIFFLSFGTKNFIPVRSSSRAQQASVCPRSLDTAQGSCVPSRVHSQAGKSGPLPRRPRAQSHRRKAQAPQPSRVEQRTACRALQGRARTNPPNGPSKPPEAPQGAALRHPATWRSTCIGLSFSDHSGSATADILSGPRDIKKT